MASLAKRNGDDSFHWTNCSPQHWKYNQGTKRWLGLEDYVIGSRSGGARVQLNFCRFLVVSSHHPVAPIGFSLMTRFLFLGLAQDSLVLKITSQPFQDFGVPTFGS